jgi:hypothetical protein
MPLAPVNEVEIGSEISGTLLTVDVTYNDHVTKTAYSRNQMLYSIEILFS